MDLSSLTSAELEAYSRSEYTGRERLEDLERELLKREHGSNAAALAELQRRLQRCREPDAHKSEPVVASAHALTTLKESNRSRPPRIALLFLCIPVLWYFAFNRFAGGSAKLNAARLTIAVLTPFALLSIPAFFFTMHEWAKSRVEAEPSKTVFPRTVLVVTNGLALIVIVSIGIYITLHPMAGICIYDESFCE